MKKVLTILLAALLVLSMSFSAFAADGDGEDTGKETEAEGEEEAEGPSATHDDVTVPKVYTVNGEEGELVPEEVLSFTVVADDGNPDGSLIEVADLNTAEGLDITISFPTYTKLGVYKYTVTENAGELPGVTYDDSDITVIVTVINLTAGGDNTEDTYFAYVGVFKTVEKETEEGETEEETVNIGGDPKQDPDDPIQETDDAAFTNDYSVGTLTVDKQVFGNLSRNDKEFTITVKFTGGAEGNCPITYGEEEVAFDENGEAEVELKLKHKDSVIFENIPLGIEYTVVEDETHTQGDLNSDEGYKVNYVGTDLDESTYTSSEEEQPEGASEAAGEIAEAAEEDTVTVQNYKNTPIQTGVFLDSLPYVLIGVAVIAVAVVMIIRKKRQSEED